ncbi:MAG: STAS domain-containing protein [Gammaproteobacteria bacterium]
MLIETHTEGLIVFVKPLEKRLTASSVPDFKQSIRNAINNDANATVILDMSVVEFLDSSGLGALVSSGRLLNHKNQFRIVGAKGAVRELFRLTRMDQAFHLFDSIDEARAFDNALLDDELELRL